MRVFANELGYTMSAKLTKLGVAERRYAANLPLKCYFIDSQPDGACALLRSLRQRDEFFDMLNRCKTVDISEKKDYLMLPPDVVNQQTKLRQKFEDDVRNLKVKEGTPAAAYKDLQKELCQQEEQKAKWEAEARKAKQERDKLNVDTASAITDKESFTQMAFGKSATFTKEMPFEAKYYKHLLSISMVRRPILT